jgi:AAA family ATP:ADP antiporter
MISNTFSIWSVKRSELSKFFLMSSMMFMILLCHNSTRVLKDSIIVHEFGPEAISFIKLWLEIPFGSIFILIYYRLCNSVTTEQAFRIIVTFFLAFYTLFAFLLYPYQYFFHLNQTTIDKLLISYPYFKWFIIIFSKWSITIFYLLAEFWPAVVFTLLFWQLANKITSYDESKVFYPYFNFFGQLNLLMAGAIVCFLIDKNSFLYQIFIDYSKGTTEANIKSIVTFVLILGIGILFCHYTVENLIINKCDSIKKKELKAVLKLTIIDSLKMTISNKLLMRIAILMMSYHVCVNTIEGIWFAKVYELYDSTDSFIDYQGKVLFYTGICGILAALLGSFLIQNYSWYLTSVLTPVILLIAGGGFFLLVLFQKYLDNFLAFWGFSTLFVIAFVGGLQNVLGKGVKYGIFDITKEMLFIPLNKEEKTKGKAAVDVIGTKCGKAIGSVIQFLTITFFPHTNLVDLSLWLFLFYSFAAIIWIYTTKKLSEDIKNNLS